MKITAEDALKKLKEISSKHLVPNPAIAIDSLALALQTTPAELLPILEELHNWQEVVLHRATPNYHPSKRGKETSKYAGVSLL